MKITSIKIEISGDSYKFEAAYKEAFNKLKFKYALRRFIEDIKEL